MTATVVVVVIVSVDSRGVRQLGILDFGRTYCMRLLYGTYADVADQVVFRIYIYTSISYRGRERPEDAIAHQRILWKAELQRLLW